MSHRAVIFAASVLILAGRASGQSAVLTVDAAAGPYTSIQSAVDAAGEGDIVLVKAGAFSGFTVIGKSVDVVEDAPASALTILSSLIP